MQSYARCTFTFPIFPSTAAFFLHSKRTVVLAFGAISVPASIFSLGTILYHILALWLFRVYDGRTIRPWMLRRFLSQCRQTSPA
ncbi:hypothetical protein BDV96DRAFT_232900 [Lophiotrema nucula]|uniref:Uncharacterized protein n=1 Tax=Lophiotrema nucula TaxID=690887 RepID=A0A6A5YRC9_9PLEO|nr:hypothetical protein BDV96DRAFT_232900 [Lophiotrema nucula]